MTFEDELNILRPMAKCVENMRSCLEYRGNYNPKENYHAGDICMIDGETNVFTGNAWEVLGGSPSYTPYTPKKIVYGTCKHCGAPLKDEVCEYCGVRNKQ